MKDDKMVAASKMNKRNINIDVLRVVLMLLIVFWHFLIHGLKISFPDTPHLSFTTEASVFNFLCIKGMLSIASAAVNCYILITGYFLIDRYKVMFRKIEQLGFLTFFYLVGITIACYLLTDVTSLRSIIKSILMIPPYFYWFISCYLGLLLLSPFLSLMVQPLSNRQYAFLLLALSVCFLSFFIHFPFGNVMGIGGSSLPMMFLLYLTGGFIKRVEHKITAKMGLVVLFVSLFLLFLGGAGYDYLHYLRGEMKYSAFFTAYNGLPFLISIGLFISFIKLKLKSKLWYGVAQLSPYVLGVYLIHDHVELRQWVWHFIPQTDFITSWSFLPVMIGYCIAVFSLCLGIDFVRAMLVRTLRTERYLSLFNTLLYRNRLIRFLVDSAQNIGRVQNK